jgi:hypothetical protein
MTRRFAIAVMALFTSAIASGSVLLAHDGHDHKVMGTVTMAAADHVMMKTTEGKDVTIQVTKDTKVTRDKQAMKVEDITVGTRVVVIAVTEKDRTSAKEIQVGKDTAKPAAKK